MTLVAAKGSLNRTQEYVREKIGKVGYVELCSSKDKFTESKGRS